MEVKLQTLHYFVKVAEEGSFTKAAEKCFVSQPALSKAIREMEDELSCALYERKGKTLVLTDAGKIVYQEAKEIIKHQELIYDKLKMMNVEMKSVKMGYIIIGHLDYFRKRIGIHKDVQIEPIYDSAANLKHRLMNDEIDLIMLPNSCELDMENVNVKYLTLRKLHVLVHKGHPLYIKDTLKFEDLSDVGIIGWDSVDLPMVAKMYDYAFIERGLHPKVVARAKKMGDMLYLMNQHDAIGFSGPITSNLSSEEYRVIPIEDSEAKYGICLVWKRGNTNEGIQKLIGQL